jgi:hypothetical protein
MKDIEKLAEEHSKKYAYKTSQLGAFYGFIAGYEHCHAEVKEQIEAVIVELDKLRKDHAGLGIVKVLLRGIG